MKRERNTQYSCKNRFDKNKTETEPFGRFTAPKEESVQTSYLKVKNLRHKLPKMAHLLWEERIHHEEKFPKNQATGVSMYPEYMIPVGLWEVFSCSQGATLHVTLQCRLVICPSMVPWYPPSQKHDFWTARAILINFCFQKKKFQNIFFHPKFFFTLIFSYELWVKQGTT